MIAFPGLLVGPAKEAGMKVPEDADQDGKEMGHDPSEFPHWTVFCNLQLGRPMPSPGAHWHNAKVVASIPQDRIMGITYPEVLELGFQ